MSNDDDDGEAHCKEVYLDRMVIDLRKSDEEGSSDETCDRRNPSKGEDEDPNKGTDDRNSGENPDHGTEGRCDAFSPAKLEPNGKTMADHS